MLLVIFVNYCTIKLDPILTYFYLENYWIMKEDRSPIHDPIKHDVKRAN